MSTDETHEDREQGTEEWHAEWHALRRDISQLADDVLRWRKRALEAEERAYSLSQLVQHTILPPRYSKPSGD